MAVAFARRARARVCRVGLVFAAQQRLVHSPVLLYNARIRRQLRTSAGLVGYSLRARLAAKRFWTLSVWEDETPLRVFVAAPPHAAVMKALAAHMGATRFTRWIVKGSDLPLQWDDALKRGRSRRLARSALAPASGCRDRSAAA